MMRRVAICFLAGFLQFGASMDLLAADLAPSTSKPETWRKEIAAFEKQDAESPPPRDAVLLVGSSSIRLWDTVKWFPDVPTINRGFGGSQICDSTQFADELIVKHHPRLIVFYAGDNDIAAGKSAEQVQVDFRAFVSKVRASLPETPIAFISIKPSIARWKLADEMRKANALIAAECKTADALEYVDVWPAMLDKEGQPRKEILRDDGLHMNESGYQLWTELLKPIVEHAEPAHLK
jgi:lysophospholipase L1-like esterase